MSLRRVLPLLWLALPSSVAAQETVRVTQLLAQLTLDEKLSMLQGQPEPASEQNLYQAGYLAGVPRLGIPPLRLADGPPGVATRKASTGMSCTMAVAATFSVEDAEQNGVVIGRDARVLGQHVVLEPFINLDRDTAWGRGFNTFGEDPLLTGLIGAAEIRGIQSQGVLAQAKHLLAFDGSYNVVVDEQTLHEVYLRPFEYAVQAGVASLMCSYNVLNGVPACGNANLLTQILRNELGFTGFVTSDWGANHAGPYLGAGLDMEMPGPRGAAGDVVPTFFDAPALRSGLARGWLREARVNQAVASILRQYERFGLLDRPAAQLPQRDGVRNAAVVLHTAQRAATLLKNEGDILPLSTRSLALIGAPALQTVATNGGGEKPGGIIARQLGALQVLRSRGVQSEFAIGADLAGVAVPSSALLDLKRNDGSRSDQLDFVKQRALPAGSAASWSGKLRVPETGSYWLNIQALGATAKLSVDGRVLHVVGKGITEQPRYGEVHPSDGNAPVPTPDGLANGRSWIALSAGDHEIEVVARPDLSGAPVQLRLAWVTPAQRRRDREAAVAAARRAKTTVVFAWAGQSDLSQPLPDEQDQLIHEVAQANANTVVVLNTSQPVAMPWLAEVRAVLQMWHPGDEGGWATVNALTGKINPGGHLPFSWPASIEQTLAHQRAHPERSSEGVGGRGSCTAFGPGTGLDCGQTTYSEGVHIGYRFFDLTQQTPLYPFGFGLSYTTFSYSDLRLQTLPDGSLSVSFQLRNTGKRRGDATPQVYLGAPDNVPPGVRFAARSLAAFTRVSLEPGASTAVQLQVPARLLQYWSSTYGWTQVTGTRLVVVGAHARDTALQTALTVTR
jgi:beta-glucosidase